VELVSRKIAKVLRGSFENLSGRDQTWRYKKLTDWLAPIELQ